MQPVFGIVGHALEGNAVTRIVLCRIRICPDGGGDPTHRVSKEVEARIAWDEQQGDCCSWEKDFERELCAAARELEQQSGNDSKNCAKKREQHKEKGAGNAPCKQSAHDSAGECIEQDAKRLAKAELARKRDKDEQRDG